MTETEQHTTEQKSMGDFSFQMFNPKILKSLVETLEAIVEESIFKITPTEFTLKAMDFSRVCLLQVILKKEDFSNYKCETTVEIGLNLKDFSKILKRINNTDKLTIKNDPNARKIKIKSEDVEKKRTKTFSLSILELDIEDIPIENLNDLEYASYWKMDPDLLKEAVKDAEIYSELLSIKNNDDDMLIFESKGMIGEMQYELDEEEITDPYFSGEQSGDYAINFLKSILKTIPIIESFKISLLTNHPLKLEIELIDGGNIIYYQAPRVENDNDDDDDIDNF